MFAKQVHTWNESCLGVHGKCYLWNHLYEKRLDGVLCQTQTVPDSFAMDPSKDTAKLISQTGGSTGKMYSRKCKMLYNIEKNEEKSV